MHGIYSTWLCHQISPACSLRQMRCLGSSAPGETGGSCPEIHGFHRIFVQQNLKSQKFPRLDCFKKMVQSQKIGGGLTKNTWDYNYTWGSVSTVGLFRDSSRVSWLLQPKSINNVITCALCPVLCHSHFLKNKPKVLSGVNTVSQSQTSIPHDPLSPQAVLAGLQSAQSGQTPHLPPSFGCP